MIRPPFFTHRLVPDLSVYNKPEYPELWLTKEGFSWHERIPPYSKSLRSHWTRARMVRNKRRNRR